MLRFSALAFGAYGSLLGVANAMPREAFDGRQAVAFDRSSGPAGGFSVAADDSGDLKPLPGAGSKKKSSNPSAFNSTPKTGHSSSSVAAPKIAHASTKPTASTSAMPQAAKLTKTSATAAPQPLPSLVERAQMALAKNGDFSGKADGVMGPDTVKALSTYQEAQGLSATGRLDVATLNKLGVSIP